MMTTNLWLVLFFNCIISLIGTLAYSVRLVGVRTGKIAVSFAMFNMFSLVSRVAGTFQSPLLAKYVEQSDAQTDVSRFFLLIILVSGISTVVGAFLIPSFQRLFTKGVESFSTHRSISQLLMRSLTKSGMQHFKEFRAIPAKENITKFSLTKRQKVTVVLNMLAVALLTTGAIAPIYAGRIAPALEVTCVTLSSVINGVASILLAVFIDPQLSIMTDDVVGGKCSEREFRACVVGMVGSKTLGTFLSLLLFFPAAHLIAAIAKWI